MSESGNWMRRMAGLLRARFPELGLEQLEDTRAARGKRWLLPRALGAVLLSLLAGRKSFREAEALTAEMSKPLRRLLGITRRIADTTMRDIVVRLCPLTLRACLHRQVKAAHRRRALEPVGFPFGVVALDGKSITSKVVDDEWALAHTLEDGKSTVGLVRTVTACLVSSASKPCIDALPIPGSTNEVGYLRHVVDELHRVYAKSWMFRMLTYDAGGCSEENARYIVDKGYEYLFAVKDSQPQLLAATKRALESAPRLARTEDVLSDKSVVTRRLHLVTPTMKALRWGNHAKTLLCVVSRKQDKQGRLLFEETRYFVSSLHGSKLSPEAWLALVRNHWGVENACHYTWDTAFEEDAHPWLSAAPAAMLSMAILRRIASNMLALFRASSRSDDSRAMPWKALLRKLYNLAIAATPEHLDGFRPRKAAAVFS